MATSQTSNALASLIRKNTEAILRDWRIAVRELGVARSLDVPTLNDHIPCLLEELARELERDDTSSMVSDVTGNPIMHGLDRLQLGFDIEEVVAEYSALREVLDARLQRSGCPSGGEVYRIVNRVLDKAIGLAVKTYAAQKALEVQQQRHEYLSFVAHDLRTPLSAISMGVHMLKKNFADQSQSDAFFLFESVQGNVARLSSMVVKVVQEENNLKAFFGQSPVRTEIALQPIVQACMDELRPLALFKGVTLVNELSVDLRGYGCATLLEQVFQNLISNAIGYSPKGEVRVGGHNLAEFTECWVSDNGAGIPADRLDHVFAKWETDPDSNRGGMGLGLNIVRHFVEAHGGQVMVESEPGQGTIFTFTLPHKQP